MRDMNKYKNFVPQGTAQDPSEPCIVIIEPAQEPCVVIVEPAQESCVTSEQSEPVTLTIIQQFQASLRDKDGKPTQNGLDLEKCRKQANERKCPVDMQRRCRIVLDAAKAGATVNGISRKYGMDNHGVKLWLRRYIQGGFANLGDAHRSGRPCVYDYEDITAKIAVYTVLKPHVLEAVGNQALTKELKAHAAWSIPLLSKVLGVPYKTLSRLIKRNKIEINPSKSWCVSKDKKFEEKMRHCDGLYKNPPEGSVVLCFDEKPCIQAIERELIRLSGNRLRIGCRYKRHGISHLFAALDVRTGHVYYRFMKRKRKTEFKLFMDWLLEHDELKGKKVFVILDNLSTHKNLGDEWMAKHPNLEFAFIPTCSSWLNLVESFFSVFTRCCLKNASWDSVEELEKVCSAWLDFYNENPIIFGWTLQVERVLAQRKSTLANLKRVISQEDLDRLTNELQGVQRYMTAKLKLKTADEAAA